MKYVKIFGMFMIGILFFSGCNEKDNVENPSEEITAAENNENHSEHLSYEIADNMRIDADVSQFNENVKIYEAVAKEFSSDILSKYFFSDLSKVKQNDNPNGTDLTAEDGSALFVGKGTFDYSSGKSIEDIEYLIQGAYMSELDYQNKNDEAIRSLGEHQVVKNALAEIEQLYCPDENEKIEILNGIKIEAKKLLDRQKMEMEKMDLQDYIDIGKYHEVDETMIPGDSYYLILGVSKNGIPIMGMQEPYVSTADEDAIYENTYIKMVVDPTGIKSIRVAGAYSYVETDDATILSPEEACDTIKKKYDMQILTSENVITKVWLEYVFVPDFKAENMFEKGMLQPYWCFEILDEAGAEDSYAERINAVSGGDLSYGE